MTDPEVRWLRSYTEDVFLSVVAEELLVADHPDFFAFQDGTTCGSVSILGTSAAPVVRVFAIAAQNVKCTAKLLNELNDVNQRALGPVTYFADGSVLVEMFIHGHGLTEASFEHAWHVTTTVAKDMGPVLAAVYGGTTPNPARSHAA